MGNWGRILSPEELGNEPAAAIDDMLKSRQYGFACIEMFKPDRQKMVWNRDVSRNFHAWKDHLALPVDTDLPSSVWASNVAVMVRTEESSGTEIDATLRLLDHYGVNSVIVEMPEGDDPEIPCIRMMCSMFRTDMKMLLAIRNNSFWPPYELGTELGPHTQLAMILDDDDGQGSRFYFERCLVMGVGMIIISSPVTGNNRAFLEKLLAHNIPVLITGSEAEEIEELYAWLLAVRNALPKSDPMQAILDSYNNVLQTPLQPLRDNLSSATYDVFEQDPVKYDKYQEAMQLALKDLSANGKALRIGILGAGRGPLVDRLLLALESLSLIPEKIFVVDKSPNAYMTLLRRKDLEWSVLYDGTYTDKIEVQCNDIRLDGGPQGLDLIVSELLGSFGDNELAPECLMEAEKLLANGGVMIPRSYTSWIEPVFCPQLHRKIVKLAKDSSNSSHIYRPYNCRISDAIYPSAPRKVFTCKHPSKKMRKLKEEKGSLTKRIRFSLLRPHIPFNGFAGYFSAVLYGPVTISTVRGNETPGMHSWFPFYLPFPNRGTGKISLMIKRCWTRERVWYEWNKLNTLGQHWSIQKT